MLSNFITNIMSAIFDFNGSGRLGRGKIYTKGAVDGQKLAGRTNDRELLALARTNKTPALQANPKSVFIKLKESVYVYWDIITARIIFSAISV